MSGAEFGGVDIDLLADYIGGVLEGTPEESAVAARIADDPAWQAAYESLGGGMALVGAELGRWEPEPMPADLARRLDEMFSTAMPALTESSATTAEPGTISGDHGATDLDSEANDSDISPESDIISPAPIAGDLAKPPVPHLAAVRGSGASESDAPGVREKRRNRSLSRRRMKWATPIAIAAGFVAFVGFSVDYLAGSSSDNSAQSTAADSAAGGSVAEQAAPAAGVVTIASGTDYTRSTLAVAPVGMLNAPAPAAGNSSAGNSSAGKDATNRAFAEKNDPLARLVPPDALQACLDEIQLENAGGVISVESVDYARFDGKPAVIVRFSAAGGMMAWASGPACGTPEGGAATLGNVPVR